MSKVTAYRAVNSEKDVRIFCAYGGNAPKLIRRVTKAAEGLRRPFVVIGLSHTLCADGSSDDYVQLTVAVI